jgi:hypothetical protein
VKREKLLDIVYGVFPEYSCVSPNQRVHWIIACKLNQGLLLSELVDVASQHYLLFLASRIGIYHCCFSGLNVPQEEEHSDTLCGDCGENYAFMLLTSFG